MIAAATASPPWLATDEGAAGGLRRAQAGRRALELVACAQAQSTFYREHLRGWKPGLSPWTTLPSVDKSTLMAHFDDWVTDRAVTRRRVDDFLADPQRIGDDLLGRYAVWTSSGTGGSPGIFLHDGAALATYEVLTTMRVDAGLLLHHLLPGLWLAGGRCALVSALDGHYAGISFWQRQNRRDPWLARRSIALSVTQPIDVLCRQLQDFQPALLASYPSMLVELAERQRGGALRLRPAALWAGGEAFSGPERAFVEQAFGCPAGNDYGCSEALALAVECRCGHLHVHDDWVLLEPVDAEGRAVPAGVPSATVLLTNLANRVAPIIRYDLGDSISVLTGRCLCGSPRPAIAVRGRCDDTLRLRDAQGHAVPVSPLALVTMLEEQAGIYCFQLRQTGPSALALRLGSDEAAAPRPVLALLARYLAGRGLPDVRLRHERTPPQLQPHSGKLLRVVCARRPLSAA